MLTREFDWLRGSEKLDNRLKRELLGTYSEMRGIPCVLHDIWLSITNRRKKYKVIIRCHEQTQEPEWQEIFKTIRQSGCKPGKTLNKLDLATAQVNIVALKKLVDDPKVTKICYDREVQALLDVASPSVNVEYFWEQQLSGKGVRVAVLDTGVHPHPDLTQPKNRLVGFVDLVKHKRNPYDDNGHGTHVAGCIAGNGYQSKGKYRAPAYNAEIVGIKVLNKMGSGSMSTVIEGINWCIANKNIQAMCLSLGSPAEGSAADDPVCWAVSKAWQAGIVVCAAAGNEGPGERTIGTPGIEPKIITVGASDDRGTVDRSDDTIANFSSRGPTVDNIIKPDLVAPGTNIISLRAPKSTVDKRTMTQSRVGDWYFTMSGTSMATPIVVGLVAQLLEHYPEISPDEVKRMLQATATDMGTSKWAQGAGYVQAWK